MICNNINLWRDTANMRTARIRKNEAHPLHPYVWIGAQTCLTHDRKIASLPTIGLWIM